MIEKAFEVSVSRVTQETIAIACPAHDAKILGLKVGSPVLQINAILYIEDDVLMELSVALFDPERFRLFSDVSIG